MARSVSPSSRVVGCRRLTGGSPRASVHWLTVATGGQRRYLVLRRWMPAGEEWTAWTRSAVEAEAGVLEGLAGCGIPAPRLVATTQGDGAGGQPALLMTREPGALQLAPTDPVRWAVEMAGMLTRIHAVGVPARPWESWVDFETTEAPRWTRRVDVWRAAMDAARAGPRDGWCFLHGDYQHFNLLWRRDRLSAVVDWVNAAHGPPDFDVGHCRLNLAVLFSAELAERFLEAYERAAERRVDPRWDVAALLSFDERWHDGIGVDTGVG